MHSIRHGCFLRIDRHLDLKNPGIGQFGEGTALALLNGRPRLIRAERGAELICEQCAAPRGRLP